MLKVSKITGRSYHPDDMKSIIYISNLKQVGAYLANGAETEVLDILYDASKETNKLVFVFAKSDTTRALYEKWNEHALPY